MRVGSRDYLIDRETSSLIVTDTCFITKLKNYLFLGQPGHYLYYDSNNAVVVTTDFRSRLDIGDHFNSLSQYFRSATLIFEDDHVIVFDTVDPNMDLIVKMINPVKTKQRSFLVAGQLVAEPGSPKSKSSPSMIDDTFIFDTMIEDDPVVDMIYCKHGVPRKIKPGPRGYAIGRYHIKTIRALGKQPSNVMVYDINGQESQDAYIKLGFYNY